MIVGTGVHRYCNPAQLKYSVYAQLLCDFQFLRVAPVNLKIADWLLSQDSFLRLQLNVKALNQVELEPVGIFEKRLGLVRFAHRFLNWLHWHVLV